MKKVLLIFSLLLVYGTTKAQSDATLEETIYWFNEYGFAMLGSNNSKSTEKYEISENGITLTITETDKNIVGEVVYKTYYISFDCLSKIYLENIYIDEKWNDFTNYVLRIRQSDTQIRLNEECVEVNRSHYASYFDGEIRFSFKNSTILEDRERFLKAMTHLAMLYGAKEKPKVTKNKF